MNAMRCYRLTLLESFDEHSTRIQWKVGKARVVLVDVRSAEVPTVPADECHKGKLIVCFGAMTMLAARSPR